MIYKIISERSHTRSEVHGMDMQLQARSENFARSERIVLQIRCVKPFTHLKCIVFVTSWLYILCILCSLYLFLYADTDDDTSIE